MVKKYNNADDRSTEERLADLEDRANERAERKRAGLESARTRGEEIREDRETRNSYGNRTFDDKMDYHKRMSKDEVKKRTYEEGIKTEAWESEQRRKFNEEMSSGESVSRKAHKQEKRAESARRKAQIAEAERVRISAERDLSREKKEAYCEKHPMMCRLKYGKQDKDEEISIKGSEMPSFDRFKESSEKSKSNESMVTVNINQGSGSYKVEKPEKEEKPHYNYLAPLDEEEPKKKTKKTFCEKHPKLCRTGKKVAVAGAVAGAGTALVATDLALNDGQGTAAALEGVGSTRRKTTAFKKSTARSTARKPSTPSKKPVNGTKKATVKKSTNRCKCPKATAKKSTVKTTAKKPASKSKGKKKGGKGMWEYGSGGLFD